MKRLFPILGVLAACSGDVPQDKDTSQHDAPSCEENAEFCEDTGEDSSGGAEEADSGGQTLMFRTLLLKILVRRFCIVLKLLRR